MLMVHNKNKSKCRFIIDWTPKAACTIICKIFFDYMDELEEALKFNEWIHRSREKYYKKYGMVTRNLLLQNNIIKIKFVRNPYSRAVSSYLHVMKNIRSFNIFNREDMSFYTFLLNLEKQKYSSDTNYNDHYNLQMIDSEKENTFHHIIKVENLEEEIKNLNKRYHINLNHNFTSNHHIIKNRIDINISSTKYSQILKIPYYNNFYDEKTKNLVDKIYNDDIIRYNYTFEDFLQSRDCIV